MSLSPITSALLGVTSAFPQSPNAVELGRISSCSWVIWILPCLAAVHLAEVGSEHPFPSGCHAAFSSQEEFCVVKTPHTSHPGDEHWLDWGETEADVELHVLGFGSWHFLPHLNTEIWGQDPGAAFLGYLHCFTGHFSAGTWNQSLSVQIVENSKQQFKGR